MTVKYIHITKKGQSVIILDHLIDRIISVHQSKEEDNISVGYLMPDGNIAAVDEINKDDFYYINKNDDVFFSPCVVVNNVGGEEVIVQITTP